MQEENSATVSRPERSFAQQLPQALLKASKGISKALPLILSVILLTALLKTYLPARSIVGFFGFSTFFDTLIGGLFGSVFAGNSINSYIIGAELLAKGAPLSAVSAFLATWVIVGIAQLPAESAELGGKFAILRTGIGFLISLIIAMVVSTLIGAIPA
jgi:uncharacterized membrane protein YraQ (UPF0718 family)